MYKVELVENKTKDWKVAQLTGLDDSKFEDVSINRNAKDGSLFPNFDGIVTGGNVEGNIWKSPTNGKVFLFPAKPKTGFTGGSNTKRVDIVKETEKSVTKAQERKEEGIKHSSLMRMSHECALAQVGGIGMQTEEYKKSFENFYQLLDSKWEQPF